MSKRRTLACVGLSLASLVSAGLLYFDAISSNLFDVAFAAITTMAMGALLLNIGVARSRVFVFLALIAAIFAALELSAPDVSLAPYFAIGGVNFVVGWIFQRSLRVECRPLILQFINVMGLGGEGTAEFHAFVRIQCWWWAVLSYLVGIVALVAMVSPGSRGPADLLIALVILAQALFFVLSHNYAARRYERPETWRGTLQMMVRPATWSTIRI